MTWKYLLPSLLLFACRDDKTEKTIDEPTEDSAEDWWDVEESEEDETSDPSEGDDDDKPDDGEKPDEGGPGLTFTGTLTLDSMDGMYELSYTDESLQKCEVNYGLAAAEAEDCSDCSFAFEMTFGDAETVTDSDACADLDDLSGATMGFGNSSTLLTQFEGIDYYYLVIDDGSGWSSADGGYAAMLDENTWMFGSK